MRRGDKNRGTRTELRRRRGEARRRDMLVTMMTMVMMNVDGHVDEGEQESEECKPGAVRLGERD